MRLKNYDMLDSRTELVPYVTLGPGDIAVAHKLGEFIPTVERADAVSVFRRLA